MLLKLTPSPAGKALEPAGRGLIKLALTDAEVLEFGKDRLACLEQLPHVTPIHAHERNGAVTRDRCCMPECLLQEAGECLDRHFADAHGEFAVADATQP